jgi:hypothetical protein
MILDKTPLETNFDVSALNAMFEEREKAYREIMSQGNGAPSDQDTPSKMTQGVLDVDLFVPYQAAFDSILDGTFDKQPIMVQMMQGWMAEAFRRFAQRNKEYQKIVFQCEARLRAQSAGKPFGNVTPVEHRPQPKYVFQTLTKLKQIKLAFIQNDVDYFRLTDFPLHVKKGFFYPAMEETIPGLMKFVIKSLKKQIVVGNDFVIALPAVILDHQEYAGIFEGMKTHQSELNETIYTSANNHLFKFI